MKRQPAIQPVLAAVALFAALVALATGATGAATYTITDLGQLLEGNAGTFAYGLNGRGHVAGASGNPFLWDGAAMRNLNPALPVSVFAPARAQDVNDAGTVVGWYTTSGSVIHPFRWSGGAFTDLSPTATAPERALAVNAGGNILVEAPASYLLRADGSRLALKGFSTGTWLQPAGLNDAGHVVGFAVTTDRTNVAAISPDGNARPLNGLPGDVNSAATAINNLGVVVGISYGATPTDANIRPWIRRNGVTVALPPRAGNTSCVPVAINDAGQVVGFVGSDLRGGERAALLWEDGQVVDLQHRIPADSGWVLRAARDVNEAGQIAGFGVRDGDYRAFVLTPVPPPLPGDANADGAVTIQDAVLAMEVSMGSRVAADNALADVAPAPSPDPRGYGDGRIDALDAVGILRLVHGL